MPKLKNISHQLCIVPLPGTSIHLAPGETTRELDEFEVQNNRALDKLLSVRRLAKVDDVSASTRGGPRASARS